MRRVLIGAVLLSLAAGFAAAEEPTGDWHVLLFNRDTLDTELVKLGDGFKLDWPARVLLAPGTNPAPPPEDPPPPDNCMVIYMACNQAEPAPVWIFSNGFLLRSTPQPIICARATRGRFVMWWAGNGQEDTVLVCKKLADDTYAWVEP
jgi:hypothetical protein